jgi:hypothetical protein
MTPTMPTAELLMALERDPQLSDDDRAWFRGVLTHHPSEPSRNPRHGAQPQPAQASVG